jgi:hypothetical protein
MSTLKDKIFKGLSYTSRDYESIMADMIKLLRNGEIYKKEGFNLSEADPMFIELSLMAAHTDILNYMLDYRILENYMSTAKERASLVRIANSEGYKIRSFRPACVKYKVSSKIEGHKELNFMTQFRPADTGNLGWVYVGPSQDIDSDSEELQFVQGVIRNKEFISEKLNNNSKTLIIDTAQVAIGAPVEGVRTSRLIVGDPEGDASEEWTEVESVLGKSGAVYELNVDPTGTTYIRFPRDFEAGDYANTKFNLYYIVTAGADVLSAPEYIEPVANNLEISLKQMDGTFIRGQDPATPDEIREGYKLYKYSGDSLISLADIKNYIMNIQKIIPNVARCTVVDSSMSTNGGPGQPYTEENPEDGFKPGEFGVFMIKGNNELPTPKEKEALTEEINKRKPIGTELSKFNSKGDNTIQNVYVQLNALPNNIAQRDAIKNLIVTYINSKPFGATLTVTELIRLIYKSNITDDYDTALSIKLGTNETLRADEGKIMRDKVTSSYDQVFATDANKIVEGSQGDYTIQDVYVKLSELPNDTKESGAIKNLIVTYINNKPSGATLTAAVLISLIRESNITDYYDDKELTIKLGTEEEEIINDEVTSSYDQVFATDTEKILVETSQGE